MLPNLPPPPPLSAVHVAALDDPPPRPPAVPPAFARALVPHLTLRVTYLAGAPTSAVFAASAREYYEGTVAAGLTVELRLIWSLDGVELSRDTREPEAP